MSRTTVDTPPGGKPPPEDDTAFLGQPRGLLTLSGLEVRERFSFPGMQAILVLYFADTVAHGDMGMSPETAASVSAAYGTLVHLVPVAGGRLADRVLGSYRAVLWGGVLIACGHHSMAVPTTTMTWVGLGLIQYVTGRRHLAGRKRTAEFALAPAAMGRAVRLTVAGAAATTVIAVVLGGLSFLLTAQTVKLYDDVSKPAHFGVNGAVAVAAGPAVMAAVPWLRRTMHPVH